MPKSVKNQKINQGWALIIKAFLIAVGLNTLTILLTVRDSLEYYILLGNYLRDEAVFKVNIFFWDYGNSLMIFYLLSFGIWLGLSYVGLSFWRRFRS